MKFTAYFSSILLFLSRAECFPPDLRSSSSSIRKSSSANPFTTSPELHSHNKNRISPKKVKIAIVGAGPAGLLLAHYLIRRSNYEIHVFEKRSDPRRFLPSELRTFPVSLQEQRGLSALRSIPGLESALERHGAWTFGACLHTGSTRRRVSMPPSLAVDRNEVALVLLKRLVEAKESSCDGGSSVRFYFDSSIEDIEFDRKILTISSSSNSEEETWTHSFDGVVAADGARSKIRNALAKQHRLQYKTDKVPDDYKPISLLRSSRDGSIHLQDDLLHGCMVGTTRIIIAPNHNEDSTYSGTCIFPSGQDPFADMKDAKEVMQYFQDTMPKTFVPLLTMEEAKNLLTRPVSTSITVQCDTLHIGDSVLLIGDAAHAVSPSLGQGCNSALQDAVLFNECLDHHRDDWRLALSSFTNRRLKCAHALEELSSYSTPRTKWMRVEWMIRTVLAKLLPQWLKRLGFLRPMPLELLQTTNLTYSEILSRTQWWTNRVKRSHPSK